ncbi:adhesion G-protein coupled receptor G4-like [Amphiura filiformis]|uniref:adhesion G-protein coupled receptor G4-like n=1 Tax=Amphiura filiformis TaxID=82378 RepID=UPI003B22716C
MILVLMVVLLRGTSFTFGQECFQGQDIIVRRSTTLDIGGAPTSIIVFQNDVISCNGLLTTWNFFPARAQPLKLLVLRPIGSGYTVVGINDVPLGNVTLGRANEYDVPELSRIAVEAGDVLGFVNCIPPTSTCGNGIFFDYNAGSRFSYKLLGDLTDATVNYTFDAIQGVNSTFSVSASVVSDPTSKCLTEDAALIDLSMIPTDEINVAGKITEVAELTLRPMCLSELGIGAAAEILQDVALTNSTSINVTSSFIVTTNNLAKSIPTSGGVNALDTRIILQSLEDQLNKVGQNFNQSEEQLQVTVIYPNETLVNTGLGYSSVPSNRTIDENLSNNEQQVHFELSSIQVDEAEVAVWLPVSSPVVFTVFLNDNLFQSFETMQDDTYVNSRIMSATIADASKISPSTPVKVYFRQIQTVGDTDLVECVYWNFDLNYGVGEWSTEGCQMDIMQNNRITCSCDHLTHFAVLVRIDGLVTSVVLDYISKIGCFVSIGALLISVLTILLVAKLRRSTVYQARLNLCLSLLALYLSFYCGIEQTQYTPGCIIIAAVLHYLLLTSIFWTAAEGILMIYLFVLKRPMPTLLYDIPHFMLKACIICWGLPLIITGITQVFIHVLEGGTSLEHKAPFCFYDSQKILICAVLVPIGLILLFNLATFPLIIFYLHDRTVQSTHNTMEHGKVRRLLAIGVLLGVTWVSGFLAVKEATEIFQYIFCILNSLLGFMIFVFFILLNKKARAFYATVCFPSKHRQIIFNS